MAYREHGVWEILDVLWRLHRGEKVRRIARVTGRSRPAIRRYEAAAAEVGWTPGSREPDEGLAAAVWARLRPGPAPGTEDSSEALLLSHKERLRELIKPGDALERGLTLTKAHRVLLRQGVQVSYSALYRFAVKHLGFGGSKGTVRVAEVAPGELAEVDFGRLGFVPDPETGRKRLVSALVVTLASSRHQYVHLTHRQRLKDLIQGMEDAWVFFGGVTKRVVLDNLKAAVLKPDRYDPFFQRTFEEYARHRDFVIDAAVPGHAKGKPHVERQVAFVRESFFRGEAFLSLEHAQQEAIRWCRTTAGLRTHGTTRRQPLAVFEEEEKPALKPLIRGRFDTPRWALPIVHPDCHVQFGNAFYSVPYTWRRHKATVRADSKLVRIYVGGNHVKTHPLVLPGQRSTDFDDFPPATSPYARRDVDYWISRGKQRGKHIGVFLEHLLSGVCPWCRIRQAQHLLRLTDKYGGSCVDAACEKALAFEILNVRRVEEIVRKGLEKAGPPSQESQGRVIQMPLRFLRQPKSFNHQHDKEENHD